MTTQWHNIEDGWPTKDGRLYLLLVAINLEYSFEKYKIVTGQLRIFDKGYINEDKFFLLSSVTSTLISVSLTDKIEGAVIDIMMPNDLDDKGFLKVRNKLRPKARVISWAELNLSPDVANKNEKCFQPIEHNEDKP